MLRSLAILIALAFAGVSPAQERHATVELDDGSVVVGRVLAMDQAKLQLQVGEEVVTIAATRLRSCRFDSGDTPAPAATPANEAPAATPAAPPAAPPASASAQAPDAAPAAQGAPEVRQSKPAEPAEPAARKKAHAPPRRTGPLPDPADPEQVLPHDLRHRSRLRQRLEALDELYPWLAPTAPTQWISLGLLLAISLCLIVYLSARVSGAEGVTLGRSMALALWYLLTGLLQVAIVPTGDFPTLLMLVGNTTLGLFWLRGLFDLTRGGAVIAFAVQIGFVVLGFALLELVDSLLGSIGSSLA